MTDLNTGSTSAKCTICPAGSTNHSTSSSVNDPSSCNICSNLYYMTAPASG